jgi:hypothetical protein
MKKLKQTLKKVGVGIAIILGLFLILGLSGALDKTEVQEEVETTQEVSSVSQSEINNFKKDLDEWANGRWSDVVVSQDNGEIVARAYVFSEANEIAINGYCSVLKESASKYISSSIEKNLFIYQNGEVVKSCL